MGEHLGNFLERLRHVFGIVALCVLLFVCSTLYGRRVLKKIVQEETEKEQTPKIAQEEMRKEQQGSLISGVREGKTSDVELT